MGIRNIVDRIKISRYAKENNIFTHLTVDEKLKLIDLSKKCKGYTLVEIGSYLGASSCFIAIGIKKSGNNAKLYCIDTWTNDAMTEGKKDTFLQFTVNTIQYKNIIIPLRKPSLEAAENFNEAVDFLFIDGDHSYTGVKADVDAWFPKLSANAVVVFHDIGWATGVQKVVREEVSPRAKQEERLPNLYWAWL